MIRFYGTKETLLKWRSLLCKEINKETSCPIKSKDWVLTQRYTVEINLTNEERLYLDALWRQDEWNIRLSFEEIL